MSYDKSRIQGGGVPFENVVITPKLVSKGRVLPRHSGSTVTGTPSPRRDDRAYTPRDNGASKENVVTPENNMLNSNITPRSGSRKARAELGSPTLGVAPDGTPTTSRPVSSIEKRDRNSTENKVGSGFGSQASTNGRKSRSGSLLSDGPASSSASRPVLLERSNSGNGITSPKGQAMFFHASDVQATITAKQSSERALPQSRLPGYVNGTENGSSGRTSAMSNNSLPDEQKSKFFYANDAVETVKSPAPRLANGITSNRPPLHTIYSSQAPPPTSPHRAPSPLKEELISQTAPLTKASPRRHTRLVSNGGSDIIAPDAKTDLSRRSSINSRTGVRGANHARSSSVQSVERSPARRNSAMQMDTSPPAWTKKISLAGTNRALPQNTGSPSSFSQDYTGPLSPSLPQSPIKPQSKIDQMNELAANARRERKVLDLEISNSSLLAINRTLEREMRKQNTELRRYRKLSRTGRLSVAPTSRCSRKSRSSETDTAIDSDEVFFSSESDNEDPSDILSAKSSASTSSRPSSPTSRSARSRFHDTDKPPLDLSAHRALLLESQKLNQSIKRCLACTDVLIADGRKALEHHAQAPDVENLGPKVLTPDEHEDDALVERGQGLLSPSLGPGPSSINPWERSLAQIGGLDGGLQTPTYSKWGSVAEPDLPQSLVESPKDADDKAQTEIELEMEKAYDVLPDGSSTVGSDDQTKDAKDEAESNYSSSYLRPASTPPPEELSFQASLDGLEDSPSPHPASQPDTYKSKTTQESSNSPPPLSWPILAPQNAAPPPNTSAVGNTPGNRSSIQSFGQYLGLQSLSIFGSKEVGGG